MARRRASMREGPLAELFRATEAAQQQAEGRAEGGEQPPPEGAATEVPAAPAEPEERTVEHVPSWEEAGVETPTPPTPTTLITARYAPASAAAAVERWSPGPASGTGST